MSDKEHNHMARSHIKEMQSIFEEGSEQLPLNEKNDSKLVMIEH